MVRAAPRHLGSTNTLIRVGQSINRRSQWPRGLRREVCGRSLAGIVGSNPTGWGDGCLSVVSVVFCQVDVSVTG